VVGCYCRGVVGDGEVLVVEFACDELLVFVDVFVVGSVVW